MNPYPVSTELTLAPTGVWAAPGSAKTQQAIEPSGKRHWTRADKLYNFSEDILGQVKNDVTGVKKVKMAVPENKEVFANNY